MKFVGHYYQSLSFFKLCAVNLILTAQNCVSVFFLDNIYKAQFFGYYLFVGHYWSSP